MKAHSSDLKTIISKMGKQLDNIITYELNGETIELGNDDLNSISPHYKADILKSVMKQLDIDSNVDIPLGTEINYQFGVKVNGQYEYLNYGNYIVYSSEKQEDLNSYKIVAYDKMLYSMVDYVDMGITYPITIRNYINAICNYLGLTFKNANDTFANYNRQIQGELYLDSQGNSMGYKFRDVLDELAQATGSTICIDDNDQLEIRYITETNDTIDEDYFKDINVTFGEKYGPINSIVLSRSAGADNVYIQDEQSIAQNGLCEIKISDNQILNWNDRDAYLHDLLSTLGGLEYYLNDYSSQGIMYYDVCDRYTAQIGNKYYSCVMFNDEPIVTQGLIENIYTNRPLVSETDYSKADKTDRKINQTTLIVDKQNQTIQSVITQTTDTSNPNSIASKQSVLTQRVDSLESAISDIADITIAGESSYGLVSLDNINDSEPIIINVKPIITNISYLYPSDNLYPSDDLFMKDRIVRFHNTTTNEDFDYLLPDDLLYYDSENYDEFMLDYNSKTCKITKKCKYNADGSVSLLASSRIDEYEYPTINLTEGNYTISILGYTQGYIMTRLMTNNIYTDQFYTKAETNTLINQTARDITLEADAKFTTLQGEIDENTSKIVVNSNGITSLSSSKVGNNEVISKINQSPEQISINANKVNISGLITAINNNDSTTIDGGKITTNSITSQQVNSSVITTSNLSAQTLSANQITSGTLSANRISGGTINASNISVENITASNINRGTLSGANIDIYNGTGFLKMLSGSAYNPYVSALNVASYADSPSASGAGISFRSSKNRSSTGSQIGYISYGSNGAARYYSNGSMNIEAGGNMALDGGYVRIKNMYISTDAIRFYANNSSTAQIVSGGISIYIKPKSGGYAYVGEQASGNKIATSSSGPSSLNVKKNLKEIKLNKVYDDFKKVNVYDYDYKYSNLENPYGFIIDEIEDTDTLKKYFESFEVEKEIVNGELLPKNDESKETIKVKEWNRDSYIKGMFIVMKSMQEQIEKQQEEIEKLKEMIKNG